MTLTEAKDILILRFDFRVSGADPASGRYFEAENHIITLDNIRNAQPEVNISDGDFTTYLTTLKNDCVLQILANVFDKDELEDNLLDCYPSLFDDLISMSMAMKVINLILTSTRSNRTERITKEASQLLYLDVNGNNSNPNFPYTKGLSQKYSIELKRVKNCLFTQRKFNTITTGAGINYLYRDNLNG